TPRATAGIARLAGREQVTSCACSRPVVSGRSARAGSQRGWVVRSGSLLPGVHGLQCELAQAGAVFGAKRLPELAASLGKSLQEFKKSPAAEAAPAPAAPTVCAAPASRTCASCQTPLQTEWAHCPKCGASTAPEPPRSAAS